MSGFPKKVDGLWVHSFRVLGAGTPRYRRTFDTKAGALAFERDKKSKWVNGKLNTKSEYDKCKLSELVELWYKLSGCSLKDGERRKSKLLIIAKKLGDPIGLKLSPLKYTIHRADLLKDGKQKKTLNNELGYLKRVFNCLIELKALSGQNPLESIKPLSLDASTLTYLEKEEIDELFSVFPKFSINPHVELIARVCLCTGARWGEAQGLTLKSVRNNAVTLGNDSSRKSGRDRTVPIEEDLYKRLIDHLKIHKRFTSSLGAFRRALKHTTIELPKGQASHVLRHSYASHFMILGGNILELKEILGHSDLKMTQRYAHLSPTHLMNALKFSPSQYLPKMSDNLPLED